MTGYDPTILLGNTPYAMSYEVSIAQLHTGIDHIYTRVPAAPTAFGWSYMHFERLPLP